MKFNIFFVRFQNFDTRAYLSSEIELCREFYKKNYNIKLIGIGKIQKEAFYFLFNKKKNFLNKLSIMFYLFKNRKKRGIFIFDTFSVYISLPLIIYRYIFGSNFRLILDVRTIPVETKSKKIINKFKRALLFAYRFFDGFTFITNGVEEVCENYIKKKFNNYHIIPSGTNTDIFKKINNPNIDFSKGNNFIVFYHGTITKNRGVIQTIKAIDRLNNKGYNIKLIVVGVGDNHIIELLKTNKNVIFLGRKHYEEIPEYIAISDIAVVPLPNILWWRVSSPLKLLEYMACEKPILLTNIEAHTNTVNNCNAVYYMKNFNINEIENGIIYMKEHIGEFNNNAYKLREIIQKKFAYNVLAENVLKYYKSIL